MKSGQKLNLIRLGRLVFRFEPFIVACECGTQEVAKQLVQIGRESGFRESGIVLGKDKIHTTVRSASRLEIPICDDGVCLIPDSYLKYIVKLAVEKFDANVQKANRFATLFRKALGGNKPPSNGSQAMKPSTTVYNSKLEWQIVEDAEVGYFTCKKADEQFLCSYPKDCIVGVTAPVLCLDGL